MAIVAVMMDTAADPGEKLDTELRDEIDFLAPSSLDDGDVKERHIDTGAVTEDKIGEGAVTTTKIAEGGVETVNLADGSVTEDKLDDGAVTAAKAGTGVSTAYDFAGNPVVDKRVYLTAAQYGTLSPPDPNTTYYISA